MQVMTEKLTDEAKQKALAEVETAAAHVKTTAAAARQAVTDRAVKVAEASDLGLTGSEIAAACPSVWGKMMVSKDLARAAEQP